MRDFREGLDNQGWKEGWGPLCEVFTGYEKEVCSIEAKYDAAVRKGEIVFYGASNFRMWKNIDNDFGKGGAQNHGFGGSTDVLLMHYAPRILFPYSPSVAVVQSGSNDYAGLDGTDGQKAETSAALKRSMYLWFHENLPDTKFIALGALLMPGAAGSTEMSLRINEKLKEFCDGNDWISYVDSSDMTFDGKVYRTELFKSDGIHLNRDGQLLWGSRYIGPAIEAALKGAPAR